MKRTLSAQHLKVQKGCTELCYPYSLTGQIRPVRLQANHQSARKPVHLAARPLTIIQSTGTIPFSSKYSLQCVKCSLPSHSPLRRTAKGEGCIAFNTLCLLSSTWINRSLRCAIRPHSIKTICSRSASNALITASVKRHHLYFRWLSGLFLCTVNVVFNNNTPCSAQRVRSPENLSEPSRLIPSALYKVRNEGGSGALSGTEKLSPIA